MKSIVGVQLCRSNRAIDLPILSSNFIDFHLNNRFYDNVPCFQDEMRAISMLVENKFREKATHVYVKI